MIAPGMTMRLADLAGYLRDCRRFRRASRTTGCGRLAPDDRARRSSRVGARCERHNPTEAVSKLEISQFSGVALPFPKQDPSRCCLGNPTSQTCWTKVSLTRAKLRCSYREGDVTVGSSAAAEPATAGDSVLGRIGASANPASMRVIRHC
jgi:hypothetical protein